MRTVSFSNELSNISYKADLNIKKILLPHLKNETSTEHKTWAKLDNNIPLISAKKLGKGNIVLVHVPATPIWSNFPLTESFVQMMEVLANIGTKNETTTSNHTVLDKLMPMKIPTGVRHKFFDDIAPANEYGNSFLLLAFLLLVSDIFISFVVFKKAFGLLCVCFFIMISTASHVKAFENNVVYDAISNNKIAIIKTNNNDKSIIQKLETLGGFAKKQANITFSKPVIIDIEIEPILFFPVVYWKITNKNINSIIKAKIKTYLETGGTIIFNIGDLKNKGILKISEITGISQWINIKDNILTAKQYDKKISAFIVDDAFIKDSTDENTKFGVNLLVHSVTGDIQ